MTKLFAVFGLAALTGLPMVSLAYAQATEGQSFYATPLSHGGISSANTQVESSGPPPMAAPMPAPPPPPVKHRRKHKAM